MKEEERHEAEFFGGPISRNNQLRKLSARKWKDPRAEARDLPDVDIMITMRDGVVEIQLGKNVSFR